MERKLHLAVWQIRRGRGNNGLNDTHHGGKQKMPDNTNANQNVQPIVVTPSRSYGQMAWNAVIVLALVAIVGLFINNRQLAGALAQMDQHNQDQIAKLTEDLSQTSDATQAERRHHRPTVSGQRDPSRSSGRSPRPPGSAQDRRQPDG